MSSAFSHGQRKRPPARPAVQPGAVSKLPRALLLLLCLAYVLPGFIGRDPWRSDGLSFVVMWRMAHDTISWLHPVIYGRHIGDGWLAYWCGALGIRWLGDWLGPITAARVPFIAALWTALSLTWYACYHFARSDEAQPVPPAFGPPIVPADYARALADGALLTLIASFGLLGRGHEGTAQVLQLAATAAVLYGTAAAPTRPVKAALTLLAGLVVLGLSGAAWIAMLSAGAVLFVSWRRRSELHWMHWTVLVCGVAVALLAEMDQGWPVVGHWPSLPTLANFFRIALWFTWPAWPLALWALWRWRESLHAWHLQLPWILATIALISALALRNADRVFLLSLPPLAVLGGFALPVMRRGALAAIDWFAVVLFSLVAFVVWLLWFAMLTGWPAEPAANIERLAPGFHMELNVWTAALSALATIAWGAVVVWRTGRHRHPLWKGMVLSASGVTLVWVLVGSLWLPTLDYASTFRGVGQQVRAAAISALPQGTPLSGPDRICVQAERVDLTTLAMLDYWSGLHFIADANAAKGCPLALDPSPPRDGSVWQHVWTGGRPGERDERLRLYVRHTPAS